MLGRIEVKRDWDPRDHPRDPRTGQFVERLFGRVRLDPVNTGLFFNRTEGVHKRPNADATRFDGLPAEHRAKMYEVWRERRGSTGTSARSYPDIVRNVERLWNDAPPETKREGGLWYRRAKQATLRSAREHDIDRDTAIAITAVLSPQQEWGSNIAMADHLMRVFRQDRAFDPTDEEVAALLDPPRVGGHKPSGHDVRPHVGKRFSEILDPAEAAVVFNALMRSDGRTADVPGHESLKKDGEPRLVTASGGFTPIANAIAVVRGAPPDDVLNGHKVRSFFNNISDPDDLLGHGDVTVDTHAVQAALDVLHLPAGGTDPRKAEHKRQKVAAAGLLAGAPSSKDLNMSGLYAMFASAYRDVARQEGIRPNHLQATVWIHWKNLKEAQR